MITKVVDYCFVVTTSVASLTLAGDVLALGHLPVKNQDNNNYISRDRILQIRADKNLTKNKIISKLNLSNAQKIKIQQIRSEYQPLLMKLRQQIRSERKTLTEMMEGTESENTLRSQHQKIMTLDQKIHNVRFEIMLQMREIFTQQQRQQWAELMEEFKTSNRGRFR